MPQILDHRGVPFKAAELKRQIATPSLTGIRQVWTNTIASGLTPASLADLLQAAADGNPHDYLTLAEEMEERDPHYASVMGVRRRSLSGLPIVVEAATDDARDQKIADDVRDLVRDDAFVELIEDLSDALGKGYAVAEINWETSAKQWRPRGYDYVDPRWLIPDRNNGRELRLVDESDPVNGIRLAAFKFLVHQPRLKSGLPIRGGLARLSAWSWLCKAYALKDWVAFCEVFGLPLRLGRYGANATDDDVAILRAAVANLGSDAAAVLPESMKIDFQQVGNISGGSDLFLRLCDFLDRQVSKGVLGQTMTTDDGSSLAQAQIHNEVRLDILDGDARSLSGTVGRDLIRAFVDLNYGPQRRYPRVLFQRVESEDLGMLTQALERLVPLGLRVEASVIRDKLGLPDPAKGKEVEVLQPPAAPALSLNAARVATNAARAPVPDTVDLQIQRLRADAQGSIDDSMAPIWALLDQVASLDELEARLLELYPVMAPDELAEIMGDAQTAAQMAGRYDVLRGA